MLDVDPHLVSKKSTLKCPRRHMGTTMPIVCGWHPALRCQFMHRHVLSQLQWLAGIVAFQNHLYEVRRRICCSCPCPFPFGFRKPEAVEHSLFPPCQSDCSSEGWKLKALENGFHWVRLREEFKYLRIRWSSLREWEQLLFVLRFFVFLNCTTEAVWIHMSMIRNIRGNIT